MRTLQDWLHAYGDSHQHPVNKLIHWFCVPLIVYSLIGMLTQISLWLTLGLLVLATVFYARLSLGLALRMALLFAILLALSLSLPLSLTHYAGLFALAWIGQFIGHRIEGKKPSFFRDLQFLLIGPAWVGQWLQVKRRPAAHSG